MLHVIQPLTVTELPLDEATAARHRAAEDSRASACASPRPRPPRRRRFGCATAGPDRRPRLAGGRPALCLGPDEWLL